MCTIFVCSVDVIFSFQLDLQRTVLDHSFLSIRQLFGAMNSDTVDTVRDHIRGILQAVKHAQPDALRPERLIGKRRRDDGNADQHPLQPLPMIATWHLAFPDLIARIQAFSESPLVLELYHMLFTVCEKIVKLYPASSSTAIIDSYVGALSEESILNVLTALEVKQLLFLLQHCLQAAAPAQAQRLLSLIASSLDKLHSLPVSATAGMYFLTGELTAAGRDGLLLQHALLLLNAACKASLQHGHEHIAEMSTVLKMLQCMTTSTSLLASLHQLAVNDADLVACLLQLLELEVRMDHIVSNSADTPLATICSAIRVLFSDQGLLVAPVFALVIAGTLHSDTALLLDLLCSPETVFLEYMLKFTKQFSWSKIQAALPQVEQHWALFAGQPVQLNQSAVQGRLGSKVLIWHEERIVSDYDLDKEHVHHCAVHPDEWTDTVQTTTETQPALSNADKVGVDLQGLRDMLDKLTNKLLAQYRKGLLPINPTLLCKRLRAFLAA